MPLLPEEIEALDLAELDPADPTDAGVLQEAAVYFADRTTDLALTVEETGVTAFRNRLGEIAVRNALRVQEASGDALTPHRAARGRSILPASLPHRMTRGR